MKIRDSLSRFYFSLPPLARGALMAGSLLALGYSAGGYFATERPAGNIPGKEIAETTVPTENLSADPVATAIPPTESPESQAPQKTASIDSTFAEGETPDANAVVVSLEPGEQEFNRKTLVLNKGEGLMQLLTRNGASRQQAHGAIRELGKYYNMRKLQIGQLVTAEFDSRDNLTALELEKDFTHLVRVNRDDKSWQGRVEDLPTITITRHAEGVIDDSLFMAGQRQGLPTSVIVELIRIYSFDVDFQREIRQGDSFEIFYERHLSEDGRRVEEGNILYARLTLSGKPINLYRHQADGDLFADYYHEDGQSARKALMKTPIEGARLTSRYGSRKHPVLGYTRMHKGLDFGAPTGTPILAAGDGVVERASRYGSYGNYVRIRHNGTYQTAYAHMSKYGRGIKKGAKVKQGQVIGYVGATGRVTARHLHYEVMMNGKQVNPLALKIPTGRKLKGADLEKFIQVAGNIDHEINLQKNHILLAWHRQD
ncbi:M23 family metallopeptidase [Emcibacter sp.]|uniref:M23 family metallopeptidase n=1 Tax=Emcibacter sp. TaxID=1979954 RepID=UPI002AA77B4D|nr:peptidoglycan DD-metalloendopeptidase family protein [Emcibacter sp.]